MIVHLLQVWGRCITCCWFEGELQFNVLLCSVVLGNVAGRDAAAVTGGGRVEFWQTCHLARAGACGWQGGELRKAGPPCSEPEEVEGA